MQAAIKAIEYYLPENVLTNDQLAAEFPEWTAEKIFSKTGISERRISRSGECSSDLGVAAAQQLFNSAVCKPDDIDYLLLCTQTPDYHLPTTACIMQDRLGISKHAGALDFNLGCSGYVYGLGLAKGLIETSQAQSVLLITAETYTKLLDRRDTSVRIIFGDAAAATLVQGVTNTGGHSTLIGPFVYGTDGTGAKNLIVPNGAFRNRKTAPDAAAANDFTHSRRSDDYLYMNGPEIFTFTLNMVPPLVHHLLNKARQTLNETDLFIFHQANKFMLDHLQKKLHIPSDKFYISLAKYGNTVSSSIPIAIKDAHDQGRLKTMDQLMVVGFGVGYSWGATLIRWIC